MENITAWLDKVKQTCQQIEQTYIDIIIDQCGVDFSVIPALSGFSPAIKWQSLYQGLPEDIYQEDAPLLVRIELCDAQQEQWMYALAHEVATRAPLLVLGSSWPFEALANWLVSCVDARHEGRPGIFRFWDTRIFPHLFTDVLDDRQKNQLHRPALFWSWLDRDDRPALLIGNGLLPRENEKSQKITFSDGQFELLMCICDVKLLLRYRHIPEAWFTSQEERFSACFRAMVSATAKGIMLDKDREEWVINTLAERQRIES